MNKRDVKMLLRNVKLRETIVCVSIGIFMCIIGYSLGYNTGVSITKEKYTYKKGNGLHFYGEEKNGCIIYHSLPTCIAITTGVSRGLYYEDDEYKRNHSKFCSLCMDEKLIDMCFNTLLK